MRRLMTIFIGVLMIGVISGYAEIVNGVNVTKMEDLLTGKISGTDMYGNQYGIDEKGKIGKAGEFRMLGEHMNTETIDGVSVTKMKDLLTGKISGTDMYGNQYGIDEKGKIGKAGEFRMLSEHMNTETIDGVSVTKSKNLLTGTISGTDMYGNQYGIDDKGKIGKAGEFRMLKEQTGSEKINGITVTKMKSLLDGKITGTDMYGDHYEIKDGKLTLIK